MGRRDDDMIVPPSDGPMFILIDSEWFSETVVWWLSPRAFQTVTKELDSISFKLQKIIKYKEIIIWKIFERNFARNCVKNGFFFEK